MTRTIEEVILSYIAHQTFHSLKSVQFHANQGCNLFVQIRVRTEYSMDYKLFGLEYKDGGIVLLNGWVTLKNKKLNYV